MAMELDVVGDVHGMIATFRAMLAKLGYAQAGGRWGHPEGRRLVLIGDLIDRGPDPLGCLELAMELERDGCAEMLLGNHELNFLLFLAGLRAPTPKNLKQLAVTRAQVEAQPARWQRCREFLMRCPLWLLLDQGRLRLVHACWEHAGLPADLLPARLGTDEVLREAGKGGSLHALTECCLKGPEQPATARIVDTDGHERAEQRIPWWEDYPARAPLVVFGHYGFPWRLSARPVPDPALLGPGRNAVCVDFGVGRRERLVAFRYGGPGPEFVALGCRDA
ncbi:MAG TPA: metallophosphoesterase [Myxococcota bacterium]|nr:metallophosphoesterase [Myxococcota bacterium]HRY93711.1 metallophosphoesterase [Myxococcota bacterium]HSA20629.1 metallophosphoesterase [Myxococcota bacterium]